MPAEQSPVNLLGNNDVNRTTFGKLLTWAVTYGRYIMIGTEIIVLLAFISRFSLDRKLTDLNEEIAQKKAILEVNQPLEKKIRKLHSDLAVIGDLMPSTYATVELLTHVQSILPPDVYLQVFRITDDTIYIEAIAGTSQGFSQFLTNMGATKRLTNLEVSHVRRSPLSGTSFQMSGDIDYSKPVSF